MLHVGVCQDYENVLTFMIGSHTATFAIKKQEIYNWISVTHVVALHAKSRFHTGRLFTWRDVFFTLSSKLNAMVLSSMNSTICRHIL